MFERPHHQRLAQVLLELDGPLLRENRCLFGGGTAMALRYGEYRESVDLDFLVSDVGSYAEDSCVTASVALRRASIHQRSLGKHKMNCSVFMLILDIIVNINTRQTTMAKPPIRLVTP